MVKCSKISYQMEPKMNSRGVDIKVYLIGSIQSRKDYGLTYAYENENIKLLTFPLKFRDIFRINNFFLCKGVSLGDTIRLYDSSRVFQCGKFPLNNDTINKFLHPPTQSVDEILLSPAKRTVSVKGILKRASDIIESPNSKRRELLLESLEGSSSITCKLWGESVDLNIPPTDTVLTANCVEVSSWKGTISLNSSVLTSLNETDEEITFKGEVEALEPHEEYSYIIVEGVILKITSNQLQKLFPDKTFQEGVQAMGRSKGLTVVEIEQYNPAKKPKKGKTCKED